MSSDRRVEDDAAPASLSLSEDWAIIARGLGKTYHVYGAPQRRLLQGLRRKGRGSYDREVVALSNLDFEVARGETVGIVGRNGCGKTTLLQLVAGTLAPTAGEVHVRGLVTGLLELGAGFNPEFSGIENVYLYAAIMGLSRRETDERLAAITDFADIGEFVHHPVKTYSSGMYMRLAFAAAVHGDPDILVIDEALAVGDEAFQRKCFARLEEMKRAGTTLLFVSHSAAAIIELCDRALLLDGGERLLCSSPKHVMTRYQKLLYARPDMIEQLREETRELDRASDGSDSWGSDRPPEQGEEPESALFDPGLVPQSTVPYPPRGAEIEDVRIVDHSGERANVLLRGETYEVRLTVRFDATAQAVKFGTTISTSTGVELAGIMSHAPGDAIEVVEAKARVGVRFRFCNRLLPGPYFVRAGVVGSEEGEDVFLHRIVDALMFRVRPEAGLPLIGLIDLTEGAHCEIAIEGEA
jgi:lipopolysaccharide transport system ATP-binding protein